MRSMQDEIEIFSQSMANYIPEFDDNCYYVFDCISETIQETLASW